MFSEITGSINNDRHKRNTNLRKREREERRTNFKGYREDIVRRHKERDRNRDWQVTQRAQEVETGIVAATVTEYTRTRRRQKGHTHTRRTNS